jgi:hypothetical protein
LAKLGERLRFVRRASALHLQTRSEPISHTFFGTEAACLLGTFLSFEGLIMSEHENGGKSVAVVLAKWGMAASLAAFLQVVLFNPGFGLALPLLPEARWLVAIRVAGLLVLVLVPAGILLSGTSLCAGGLDAGKKAVIPAIVGLVMGLLTGIPVSAGFIQGRSARISQAQARELPPHTPAVARPVRGATVFAQPPAPSAAGVFVSAPERADMVHDAKRNRLYITAGNSLLQYQLDSKSFLPPLALGTNLRGLDISPDGDWLAVADAAATGREVWIYLVDLRVQTNQLVAFPAQRQESGTYSVAIGEDGGVWITSTLKGSGFTPLRKYTPATRTSITLGDVSKGTMLSASADRKMIAFAQAGMTPGAYGQFSCRATQLPKPQRADGFVFEVGISRDGAQIAAPTYTQVLLSGANTSELPERECVGVVFHPQRDFVFLAEADSSFVAAYESRTFAKAKQLNFGSQFHWTGGNGFEEGRLRISKDGALLFCSVPGGVRYMETGL